MVNHSAITISYRLLTVIPLRSFRIMVVIYAVVCVLSTSLVCLPISFECILNFIPVIVKPSFLSIPFYAPDILIMTFTMPSTVFVAFYAETGPFDPLFVSFLFLDFRTNIRFFFLSVGKVDDYDVDLTILKGLVW